MPEKFATDDMEGIRDYFRRVYTRPRKWPWLDSFDGVAAEAKPELKVAKVVSLSLPAGMFRRATLRSRYEYAAWHWLAPFQPMTLADIGLLKNISGLNHIKEQIEFAAQLMLYCARAAAEHPRLSLWVNRRNALLEMLTVRQAELPSETVNAQSSALHNLVAELFMQKTGGPPGGGSDELSEILSAIASEAMRVLSRSGHKCRISANLMIPTSLSDAVRSGVLLPGNSAENANIANLLWADEAASAAKCLLVVAETVRDTHAGFWVPLIRSASSETLPGAYRAYSYDSTASIFKHDLPNLERLGFSSGLNGRWKEYIMRGFEERLFVSIPVRTPVRRSRTAATVAAIVNVNANPLDENDWSRAYHREWLEIVEKNIRTLTALCCYSFISDELSKGNTKLLLDNRSEILHIAPYIQPKLLPYYKEPNGEGSRKKKEEDLE